MDTSDRISPAGRGQGGCELWPAIEGISPLAGLGLDVLADERHSLGLGEPGYRGSLGFDAEARSLLPVG